MATTEERLTDLRSDRVPTVEELEELWRRGPDRTTSQEQDGRGRRRLLAAWAVVIGSIVLFEPAPTNPAAVPMWATLLAATFWLAFFGAAAGLGRARPWAPRASMTAAGLGLTAALGCGAMAGHQGLFWAYEAVAFTGLLAASRHVSR